jgi:hypothetical protein
MNTATKSKPTKAKILSVRIERKPDETPDTSWLGEYTQKCSGWFIDLEAGNLCELGGHVILADNPPGDTPGRNDYRYISGFQHDAASWDHCSDKDVAAGFLNLRYHQGETRWGKSTRLNIFEKYGVRGWRSATTRAAKIRVCNVAYCCLDAQRLHDLNRGEWHYVGIIAKAEFQVGSSLVQTFRSGGLWGVESDSDESYFTQIEGEQLSELRDQLEAIGFKKRAIDYAFKNVERKD